MNDSLDVDEKTAGMSDHSLFVLSEVGVLDEYWL